MSPIFDEHTITEAEQLLVGRENDKRAKAYAKFMAKQMKKPRHRYVKKLLAESKK